MKQNIINKNNGWNDNNQNPWGKNNSNQDFDNMFNGLQKLLSKLNQKVNNYRKSIVKITCNIY